MNTSEINELISKFEMYNPELKLQFLKSKSNYRDKTFKLSIERFHSFKEYEERYDTDLSNFNEKQLLQSFDGMGYSSNTLKSVASLVNQYIKYINKGSKIKSVIKLLKENNILDDAEGIKVVEGFFQSREDFYNSLADVCNFRDKLVLSLIYEGLDLQEILDLKMYDFKGSYLDINDEYCLELDNNLIEIINEAINEPEYIVGNGNPDLNAKSTTRSYIKNDIYLVKFTKREKKEEDNRSKLSIIAIVSRLKKSLKREKLSITNITESSIVNYLLYCTWKYDNNDVSFDKLFKRFRIKISDAKDKAIKIYKYKKLFESFKLNFIVNKNDKQQLFSRGFTELVKRNEFIISPEKIKEIYKKINAKAEENKRYGLIGEEVLLSLLQDKYGNKNV